MEHDIEARTVLEPDGAGIIGSKVCKRFGFRMFRGVVQSFDPEVSWYCVKYEDSDQEEVDEDELRQILVDTDAISCLPSSSHQSINLKRKSHPLENDNGRSLDLVGGNGVDSRSHTKWLSSKLSNSFGDQKKSCRSLNNHRFMKLSATLLEGKNRETLFPDEIAQETVLVSTDREMRGNHSHEQIFPFLIPKRQTARYSKRLKMEHRKPLDWPMVSATSGKRMEAACSMSRMHFVQKAWSLSGECMDMLVRLSADVNVEEVLDQDLVQRAKNIQRSYYEEWINLGSLDRRRFDHVQNDPNQIRTNSMGPTVLCNHALNEKEKDGLKANPVVGHVPGIPTDLHLQLWGELHCLGIHSPQNGSDCVDIVEYKSETGKTVPLALSLVVRRKGSKTKSAGVDEVVYQGLGCGDGDRSVMRSWSDEGLYNSHKFGAPIRVVQHIKDTMCAMNYRYVYKGLWWVVGAWSDLDSPRSLKFRLARGPERQLTSGRLKQIPIDHIICEDFSFGTEAKKISVVNNVDGALPPGILQDSKSEEHIIGYETDDSWFEYTHKYLHHPNVSPPQTPEQNIDPDPHVLIEKLNMCKPYIAHSAAKIPLLTQRRSILFECGPWCKCKYGKKCHYAVTERGIQFKLQVFRTQGKGWGLKTLEYIPAGAHVITYTGMIIPQKGSVVSAASSEYLFEMCQRTDMSDDNQFLDENRSDIEVEYAVDAKHHGNVARFINHSCDPNVFVQPTLSNHLNVKMPKICLFASMDIFPGEELTYDYGIQFVVNYLQGECLCGSANCIAQTSPVGLPMDDDNLNLPVPYCEKSVFSTP